MACDDNVWLYLRDISSYPCTLGGIRSLTVSTSGLWAPVFPALFGPSLGGTCTPARRCLLLSGILVLPFSVICVSCPLCSFNYVWVEPTAGTQCHCLRQSAFPPYAVCQVTLSGAMISPVSDVKLRSLTKASHLVSFILLSLLLVMWWKSYLFAAPINP